MSYVLLGGAAISATGSIVAADESKPNAPAAAPFTPVNLQQTQQQAVSGDQTALPGIDSLLSSSNTFQQQQATALKNASLPGYSQLAGNLTSTASSLAANPYGVPQSVSDQLTQYAAEQNIGAGTGASSGFSGSNLLRSLGVNALQYGQSNLNSAMSALSTLSNTAPTTSPMSPLSFLVTPSQQASNQLTTNTNGQAIQQGANNAQTAAANSGSANLWSSIASGSGSLSTPLMNLLMGAGGSGAGGTIGGLGAGGGVNAAGNSTDSLGNEIG